MAQNQKAARIAISSLILLNICVAIFRIDVWPLSVFYTFSRNLSVAQTTLLRPGYLRGDELRLLSNRGAGVWQINKYARLLHARDYKTVDAYLMTDCKFALTTCASEQLVVIQRGLHFDERGKVVVENHIVYRKN